MKAVALTVVLALGGADARNVRGESTRSLLAVRQTAHQDGAGDSKIHPELWPVSDKAFFGHDYPQDMQPRKLHAFDHPHPVVQESDEYDIDYPKDENHDGGEWKAQFTYDTLRSKIHAGKNLERMRKQMLKEADEAEKKAEKDANEADAAAAKARGEAEHEEALDAANRRASGADAQTVEGAMKDVEAEMKDLEDCKKKLKDAQDHLKEMMDKKQKGKTTLEDIKAQTEAEVAAQEKAEAAAEALAAAQEKEKARQEAKAKEEAEIYQQAKKEWTLTEKELKEMESKLKGAEQRLRQFRNKAVTPGGGIYRTPDEKKYDPCEGCDKKDSTTEDPNKYAGFANDAASAVNTGSETLSTPVTPHGGASKGSTVAGLAAILTLLSTTIGSM